LKQCEEKKRGVNRRKQAQAEKKAAKELAEKLASEDWIPIEGWWAAQALEGRGHQDGPHYGRKYRVIVERADFGELLFPGGQARFTEITGGDARIFNLPMQIGATISFDFEIDGIAMEFLFGRTVSKEYSLLGVGTSVAEDRYHDAGLIGLEVVFLALAVIVPLLELGCLLALWLAPLRLVAQKALLHVVYFLDSWSSLDVAALVLVIATSEFGRMAEFLVYKSGFATPCSMIKDLTASECLEVNMHARGWMAVVISAGLLLILVPKVTLRLCADAISKRTGYPVLPKKVEEIDGNAQCEAKTAEKKEGEKRGPVEQEESNVASV